MEYFIILLIFAAAIGIIYFMRLLSGGYEKKLCLRCHAVDTPKRDIRGSLLIEIVLWLCFILPGLIYSIWRTSSSNKVCRNCGSKEMIPIDSPRAREVIPHP